MSKFLALAAALALGAALQADPSNGSLTVGDKPPALEVSAWVKGDAVKSFESGKVYVVEFWATWCGPCRKSIPHLTELQKEYREKGVTIIGVSVWENDQAAVKPFVEKQGDNMAYTIAMDAVPAGAKRGDGAMAKAWMDAAGEDGIPAAFVIDRTGTVAWIGSPFEIDKPLAAIVDGKWDVAKAKADRSKQGELAAKQQKLNEQIRAEDWKGVLASVDEMIAAMPDSEPGYSPLRFRAMLGVQQYDGAYAYAERMVAGPLKDDAERLNMIAWTIVDPESKGIAKRDTKLALRAAERACELTKDAEPAILDTLARVHFVDGRVPKAIELQTKACELMKGKNGVET